MKSQTGISTTVCLVLFAGLLATSGSYAQQEEQDRRDRQQTRQAQAVSKPVYDKIQQAQTKIDEEDHGGALRILDVLMQSNKLTEYELSQVLNYIAFVHYSMGNTKAAKTTYQDMLRIATLEVQMRKQVVYTLAQLSTMDEEYRDAIRLLEEWFSLEPNPEPEPYILYAQVLYQVGRHEDMIVPIETAMTVAKQREKEVREDWYVLLSFAYFQQENYRKVRDIHKILLANWPTKRYWLTLAGAYAELADEDKLFAAYAAAHTQGLLEQEAELITMAQLYMQHEVPYKAAVLLHTAMEMRKVSQSAKNYRLLSQAWSLAQEDEKSVPALQKAAELGEDGQIYLRLGNAYLNLGRYPDCITSIESGMSTGGIKNLDSAWVSLGMCHYNLQDYGAALSSFNEVQSETNLRKTADAWIKVIKEEVVRNRKIAEAEAQAREQIKALASRREVSDSY